MHGTPAQQLFSRARRDFSHGCIRLEDPARFAEWVLRDQPDWTRARIEAAMQGDRRTRVNLKQPLTVVLFYDTVHVNSEAVLFFVDDIYGHDARSTPCWPRATPIRRGDSLRVDIQPVVRDARVRCRPGTRTISPADRRRGVRCGLDARCGRGCACVIPACATRGACQDPSSRTPRADS